MNRYFIVKCDEEGQPVDEELVEIAPPTHFLTLPFSLGVLVGCILMRIFG
jgi:hypothetical protein